MTLSGDSDKNGRNVMIEKECSCEMKVHRAPLNGYVIESGAVKKLPEVLKDYQKIYMVCGENTFRVIGETAEKILLSAGKTVYKLVLKGKVLPTPETIGNVLIHLNDPKADSDIFGYSPKPDIILAVGSGVINDVCRLVSYRVGIPYAIVGTAPSMDGYASAGSPTLFDGTKATIKCTTPKFIVADIDVMKDAPYDMLLSGIGDMLGKYIAILDWELARDYNDDYYCEEIANDVIAATDKCLENGYDLKKRAPECIKNIMEGFMVTGLGMAFTRNSRPASGSEHIIAHAWELASVEKGEKPNLHGLEVCEGTRITADMYKRLYGETKDEHLKSLIAKYLPYFDKVEEFCVKMDMPSVTKDYDNILKGIKRALNLRNRYTLLFYLRDNGMFDDYAEWAAKEILKRLK